MTKIFRSVRCQASFLLCAASQGPIFNFLGTEDSDPKTPFDILTGTEKGGRKLRDLKGGTENSVYRFDPFHVRGTIVLAHNSSRKRSRLRTERNEDLGA